MFSFKCLPLRVASARAFVISAALGIPSRCARDEVTVSNKRTSSSSANTGAPSSSSIIPTARSVVALSAHARSKAVREVFSVYKTEHKRDMNIGCLSILVSRLIPK